MRLLLLVLIFTSCLFADEDSRLLSERWYSWANFYYNLGKMDKAFEFAEKTLEINPYHEGAFLVLQQVREKKPDLKSKWESISLPELKSKNKDTQNWYTSGLERFFKADFVRSFYCFLEAFKIDPDDEAVRIMYYRSHFKVNLSQMAAEEKRDLKTLWNKVVAEKKKDSESSYYWFLLGKYYYEKTSEQQKGLDCFEISLALDDKNQDLIAYLKGIEDKKKAEEEAKQELERQKLIEFEKRRLEEAEAETKRKTMQSSEEITALRDLEAEKKSREEEVRLEKLKKYKASIDITEIKTENFAPKTEEVSQKPPEEESAAEKSRKLVKKFFGKGEKLLNASGEIQALPEIESAFLEILRQYPEDLKSNYYLMLIALKKGETGRTIEFAMDTMKIVQKYSYPDKEFEQQALENLDCYLRSVVIQAALEAFNNREKMQLDQKNFDMKTLEKMGYLKKRTRNLKLDFKTPEGKQFKLEWKVEGNKCGRYWYNYFLNPQGLIECQVHGLSPFLKENALVEEY
ncbi:MAG: hypothetical protein PHW04_08075 [Candidatus Wallbacteria bacterium]|nr:hypothetical protein [Candidatus Wallbacteria bacterium]